MHLRMLSRRAGGFTVVEVVVALALTAVIGATISGVFVSQTRFFDRQEKVGFARSVSRGALNMILSEMRMIERSQGVVSATNRRVTLRVPYAFGMSCGISSLRLVFSRLPADPSVIADSAFTGFAYRNSTGAYTYVEGGPRPMQGSSSVCSDASANVAVVADGEVLALAPAVTAPAGTPVFLYQIITYEFKASTSVPGRTGLFRTTQTKSSGTTVMAVEEELVAPFDTTAGFRFFVNDAAAAQTAVPATLNTITGFELTLDGLSERPNSDGTHQTVPLKTSVFFRNR